MALLDESMRSDCAYLHWFLPLADTPSTTANLDVPGNLLTTQQMPFCSFSCALA
jgi:hypothetical protein